VTNLELVGRLGRLEERGRVAHVDAADEAVLHTDDEQVARGVHRVNLAGQRELGHGGLGLRARVPIPHRLVPAASDDGAERGQQSAVLDGGRVLAHNYRLVGVRVEGAQHVVAAGGEDESVGRVALDREDGRLVFVRSRGGDALRSQRPDGDLLAPGAGGEDGRVGVRAERQGGDGVLRNLGHGAVSDCSHVGSETGSVWERQETGRGGW